MTGAFEFLFTRFRYRLNACKCSFPSRCKWETNILRLAYYKQQSFKHRPLSGQCRQSDPDIPSGGGSESIKHTPFYYKYRPSLCIARIISIWVQKESYQLHLVNPALPFAITSNPNHCLKVFDASPNTLLKFPHKLSPKPALSNWF